MKINEVIKFSQHKLNSDGSKFRQNMGVRDLNTFYSGPKGAPDPQPKNKLIKVLGHGAYATAVQGKDSNSIMKISRGSRDLNEDPYFLYLSRIASGNHMETNPFIPRVHEVKVYQTQDPSHPYFYVVKMEKLENIRNLSEDELIQMITALTKAKMTNRLKSSVGLFNGTEVLKKQGHGQLIEILVDKIRQQKIKDLQLQKAMDLAASTGMEFDITPSNIMVRRTQQGPQLVLADPVRN